jgi:NAD(P)H-dependent FMN reductase
MREPIYNSGIPGILKSANGACGPARFSRRARFGMYCLMALLCTLASASDWNSAEKQLAQKIAAVTGPGAAALTVQNRSSLGKRDSEIVQNGLESALQEMGVRLVNKEQAAASIALSLSENQAAYVWVAEIRQGDAESAVAMVSVPRTAATPGFLTPCQ